MHACVVAGSSLIVTCSLVCNAGLGEEKTETSQTLEREGGGGGNSGLGYASASNTGASDGKPS